MFYSVNEAFLRLMAAMNAAVDAEALWEMNSQDPEVEKELEKALKERDDAIRTLAEAAGVVEEV